MARQHFEKITQRRTGEVCILLSHKGMDTLSEEGEATIKFVFASLVKGI